MATLMGVVSIHMLGSVTATPVPPTPCPSSAGPQCRQLLASGLGTNDLWSSVLSVDGTMVAVGMQATPGLKVFYVASGSVVAPTPSYSKVHDARVSPDGAFVAAAAYTQGACMVSLATGDEVWCKTTEGNARSVAYSPDGGRVATGHTNGEVYVRDPADGAVLLTLSGGHSSSSVIEALQYTPDGTRIISSGDVDDDVVVWDAVSGAVLATKLEHRYNVYGVAVSPDGAHFVTASQLHKFAVIYDARDSNYTALRFLKPDAEVFAAAFSPNSEVVVLACGSSKLAFYSVRTGALLYEYTTDSEQSLGVSWAPSGDFIVSGGYSSGTVLLWDSIPNTAVPPTLVPLTTLVPTPAPLTAAPPTPFPPTAAPSPAPPTAVPTAPPATAAPTPAPTLVPQTTHPSTPEPAASDAPSGPASCPADAAAGACDVSASRRCLLRVLLRAEPLSVAYSPDSREVVVAGSDGVVRVFSAVNGNSERVLGCADFPAYDVAFSPDGARVAVGGGGGRVVVCNSTSGAALLQVEGSLSGGPGVRRVLFSPDGRVVVAAGRPEAVMRLHDAVSGGPPHLVIARYTRDAAFTPDGAHLATVETGDFDYNTVRVLSAYSGQEKALVASSWARVVALSFSPDGHELAQASEHGVVHVGPWAAGADGSERLRLQHASGHLFDVRHSPDGRLIAAAGWGTVSVWDAHTGLLVAQLSGHKGAVHRLNFSPDGTRVATVSLDGTLLLWDLAGL